MIAMIVHLQRELSTMIANLDTGHNNAMMWLRSKLFATAADALLCLK